MSEDNNTQESLSKDEINAIDADIAKARKDLVSEDTEKAIEKAKKEAREQALQEAEVKKELEERDRQLKELQEKLKQQEEASSERLEQLKKTVDSLKGSKAVVSSNDPFNSGSKKDENNIDNWSDEKVNNLERASAEAFFGEGFDDRI